MIVDNIYSADNIRVYKYKSMPGTLAKRFACIVFLILTKPKEVINVIIPVLQI